MGKFSSDRAIQDYAQEYWVRALSSSSAHPTDPDFSLTTYHHYFVYAEHRERQDALSAVLVSDARAKRPRRSEYRKRGDNAIPHHSQRVQSPKRRNDVRRNDTKDKIYNLDKR